MADILSPMEMQIQQQAIERNRRLAEMLQAQSMQAPQGQMVSGHYVKSSPLEYIAKLAQGLIGSNQMKDADTRAATLAAGQAEAQKQDRIGSMQQYADLLMGKPAVAGENLGQGDSQRQMMYAEHTDSAAPDIVTPGQAAVAPNPRTAAMALMNANSPELQKFGMEQILKSPQTDKGVVLGRTLVHPVTGKQIAVDSTWQDEQKAAREAKAQELQFKIADQQAGRAEKIQAQKELRELIAASRPGPQPYYQPVQTGSGVMSFNARTGKLEPAGVAGGNPVIGSASDPALQRQIAEAKKSGTVAGEAKTTAQIDLPKVIQQGEDTIRLVDDLLKAPGKKLAVGTSSLLQIQHIPGTDAKEFMVRLNQLKGKQFLEAFQSLKGGGQITEVEGKKATEAISRMDNANTEADFDRAANEFKEIIRAGVSRAKEKAGGASGVRPAPSILDAADAILNKGK